MSTRTKNAGRGRMIAPEHRIPPGILKEASEKVYDSVPYGYDSLRMLQDGDYPPDLEQCIAVFEDNVDFVKELEGKDAPAAANPSHQSTMESS